MEKKRGKVEERIEREKLLLSDRMKEVGEEMETEDAAFMQVKLFTPVRIGLTASYTHGVSQLE